MSLAQSMDLLQYMFQMTVFTLIIHLRLTSKAVNHPDTHWFRYGTYLLGNDHFEFSNRSWVVLKCVILQQTAEIKIRGFRSGEYGFHLGLWLLLIRQSGNQWLSYSIMMLAACGVASSCWNRCTFWFMPRCVSSAFHNFLGTTMQCSFVSLCLYFQTKTVQLFHVLRAIQAVHFMIHWWTQSGHHPEDWCHSKKGVCQGDWQVVRFKYVIIVWRWSFGTCAVKNTSFELKTSNHWFLVVIISACRKCNLIFLVSCLSNKSLLSLLYCETPCTSSL